MPVMTPTSTEIHYWAEVSSICQCERKSESLLTGFCGLRSWCRCAEEEHFSTSWPPPPWPQHPPNQSHTDDWLVAKHTNTTTHIHIINQVILGNISWIKFNFLTTSTQIFLDVIKFNKILCDLCLHNNIHTHTYIHSKHTQYI